MNECPKKMLSLKQKKLKFAFQQPLPSNGSPDLLPPPTVSPNNSSTHSVVLSGLCNLGNTCYANCILQVLRFCPQFRFEVARLSEYFSAPSAAGESEAAVKNQTSVDGGENVDERGLVVCLHMLWQRMSAMERVTQKPSLHNGIKPSKFLSKLRQGNSLFDNLMQQDAQEMLRFLLTSLQTAAQMEVQAKSTKATVSGVLLPCDKGLKRGYCGMRDGSNTPTSSSCTRISRKRLISQEEVLVMKKLKSSAKNPTVMLTDFYRLIGAPSKKPRLVPKLTMENGKTEASKREGSLTATKRLPFITEMFQGELVSQIHCFECDNLTRRTEPFLDISVPVSGKFLSGFPACSAPVKGEPNEATDLYWNANLNNGLVGPLSLSWALAQFCYREKLCGENKYRCENCRHLVEAEKTVLFGDLPLVMTIHLNRFATHISYNKLSSVSVSKIGGNIAVPTSLCLSAWCSRDCPDRDVMYHLFAVVYHLGSSCSSGHYTACVREKECCDLFPWLVDGKLGDRGRWFYFDDEVVEALTMEEVLNMLSPLTPSAQTAYILFYTMDK